MRKVTMFTMLAILTCLAVTSCGEPIMIDTKVLGSADLNKAKAETNISAEMMAKINKTYGLVECLVGPYHAPHITTYHPEDECKDGVIAWERSTHFDFNDSIAYSEVNFCINPETRTDSENEATIIHELGHSILQIEGHDDDGLKIMNTHAMDDKVYVQNRDQLIADLFNVSIDAVQDCSK